MQGKKHSPLSVAVLLHNESAIKSVDDHSAVKAKTATVREGTFPFPFLLVNIQRQNTARFLKWQRDPTSKVLAE